MQEIRKHYPVLSQYLYANTASTGLLSDRLVEWRQEHDLDFLIGGSIMKMKSFDLVSETKDTVGDFFGCKRDRVALVPNFSTGLNFLLEGLDKSSKVLLLEEDYPSVNWPFEMRGFPLVYARIDESLEQNILEKIRAEKIDVFALSLVQWTNGIVVDLNFLKSLKQEFPELIIIADGTQFCGAFDFDFDTSGIDILGASSYKWLLAGFGNGFFLFKEEIAHRFEPKAVGYNTAGERKALDNHIRFSKYFEPGHQDSFNFGSLKFALENLSEIGMPEIIAQNQKLQEHARSAFASLGLLEEKVVKRKDHSTIFNIRGTDQMFKHLVDNNVVCSQRGAGIRLSFHFYNTVNEIDQIAEIIKSGI
ncbi:aminotransferase class V-fold PLP-dependent enzyme [Poritiphilus flavus]|uniref:Aminotransferase class V-fold PLP-dependent enzyme n=1 Tax=Poritiphilus flavus TaxID=2697053 RepID=A0A6L9EHG1_9FLAO|nr:aminotransferase class V-fold PLP-dependent enzyme [Poritiphilus flavus]NAS13928.1 aminotransferase class V-fold PLP-dependent enzyme [Poritiphilus flavus]